MKKYLCVLLAILMTVSAAACGADNNASDAPADGSSARTEGGKSGIDVDLTKLSSTMVYAEVYNMMMSPEEYIGKTVKMKGQFALYQATDQSGRPIPDQIYFACVIADATACCQQGLEFILGGNSRYPDDYPEPGTEITVVGEYQTYMEGTQQYCHLINAGLAG